MCPKLFYCYLYMLSPKDRLPFSTTQTIWMVDFMCRCAYGFLKV